MDKSITTALFIIIGMIMALSLFNVAYPAIQEGGDAISGMTARSEDRLRTQVRIIHASSELDADGNWQDANMNGVFEVYVWVKNVGDSRIDAIEQLDVFFGQEGNQARLGYDEAPSTAYPYWGWDLESSTNWDPGSTLCITIRYQAPIASARYYAKITTLEGVSSTYFLGI